jgi:hypothetical protein
VGPDKFRGGGGITGERKAGMRTPVKFSSVLVMEDRYTMLRAARVRACGYVCVCVEALLFRTVR